MRVVVRVVEEMGLLQGDGVRYTARGLGDLLPAALYARALAKLDGGHAEGGHRHGGGVSSEATAAVSKKCPILRLQPAANEEKAQKNATGVANAHPRRCRFPAETDETGGREGERERGSPEERRLAERRASASSREPVAIAKS